MVRRKAVYKHTYPKMGSFVYSTQRVRKSHLGKSRVSVVKNPSRLQRWKAREDANW